MPHPPHPRTFRTLPPEAWVLPEHQVVYVPVAAVASTSLTWLFADLAGEDHARIDTVASGVPNRPMTIHAGRSRFRHVRSVHDLPDDEVARIGPDDGWFVLGAVRDPWSRLWSAWQSTFLARADDYARAYGDEPFFPRVPHAAPDVVEDFRRFVELAPWTTHPRLQDDPSFRPQVRALLPEAVPFGRIYDLSELDVLPDHLHAHLDRLGKDQALVVPPAVEPPLRMTREVWSGGLKEEVERLYRDDLDAFGERWDFDALDFAPDGWTQDALTHAAYRTEANDWIGQVWSTGKRWRRQRDAATRKLRATERQAAKAEQRVKRLKARNDRLRQHT